MEHRFAELRRELQPYGPPVIVFNKSHSGSRLLAQLLEGSGFYLGADMPSSRDSLDVLRLVEYVVGNYYPDYGRLFRSEDSVLFALIREVFARHLKSYPGGRWGWKLCETGFILPLLDEVFPDALYLHLLRDGRDVAFSNHIAPRDPFWRKVYFNTDRIKSWRGLPLSRTTYRLLSPLYNARHWSNSVIIGRAFGSMLGTRYLEVRYEDLVLSFRETSLGLLQFLGVPPDIEVLDEIERSISRSSIGKYRKRSVLWRWLAMQELEPALSAFGYGPRSKAAQPFVPPRLAEAAGKPKEV
jgi:Sulfotransferase family